jgi:hypothetical protein
MFDDFTDIIPLFCSVVSCCSRAHACLHSFLCFSIQNDIPRMTDSCPPPAVLLPRLIYRLLYFSPRRVRVSPVHNHSPDLTSDYDSLSAHRAITVRQP